MGDDKHKKHNDAAKPKLWLGREIVKPEHEQDLERAAAIGEFDRKMPRGEAEEKAYSEYKKRQHLEGAVHHLQGMKAAHASGSMDDAHRHGVMYELHLKQLGHDGGNGPVPEDVQSLLGEAHDGPYKFSPHGADAFVLSQDHEMKKADLEKIGGYSFTEEESGTPLRKEKTMCKKCKLEKCVCKKEETPGEKRGPEETSSASISKGEAHVCGVCGCRSCVCGELHKAEVRAKVTSLLTVAAALLDLKKSQSK